MAKPGGVKVVKVLSTIAFSMISAMFCHVAGASTCSNRDSSYIDSDDFDKEARHSIHSACFGGYTRNDRQEKLNSDDFSDYYHYFKSKDDDNEYAGVKPGKHGKSPEYGSSEHDSEHDFDWSAYKLDYHHEYEYHHGYGEHQDRKRWYKHDDRLYLPHKHLDLVAVPVPAALWLFGSGLISLLALSRRKYI